MSDLAATFDQVIANGGLNLQRTLNSRELIHPLNILNDGEHMMVKEKHLLWKIHIYRKDGSFYQITEYLGQNGSSFSGAIEVGQAMK